MPARKTKAPRKKALKTKLKQDPIGTMKGEVNKTGALKYPIGAYILGAIGGAVGAIGSAFNVFGPLGVPICMAVGGLFDAFF